MKINLLIEIIHVNIAILIYQIVYYAHLQNIVNNVKHHEP